MRKNLVLISILIMSLSVISQTDTNSTDIFDMTLEDLMNLKVTSVSKSEEDLFRAPQTIIVITHDELIKRGYTDVEQVLHDLPGFDISRGNGTQYSQVYQRGYRSNNTERTSFQINGIEENDLWSSSVWLSRQYPLSNIKRIEIIYGPSSTMYGANAFVGVINIVTFDAEDVITGDYSFGVYAGGGYGTWNTMYSDVTIAGKKNDLSFVLTGRVFKSDEMDLSGYDDWDYDLSVYDENYYANLLGTDNSAIIQRAMQLDQDIYFNSDKLNGIAPHYSNQTNDWLINGKIKIKNFETGYQIFRRDEGYGAWYRDDYELGPDNGGRWVPVNSFIYSRYENEIFENLTFTNFNQFKVHKLVGDCEEYYYGGYLNGALGLSDLADSSGVLLPDSLQGIPDWWHGWFTTYSQQFRTENRFNYNPNEKFILTFGFEYRSSHIQGTYFTSIEPIPEQTAPAQTSLDGGNHFFSTDIGLFTLAKYSPFDNLDIVLGGRVDNNKVRINQGYGFQFNPKAAIIYTPKRAVFKLMYSEAFMDAGYWTKYGTTPGRLLTNPNLEPEKVKNFEAVAGWRINSFIYAEIVGYNASYHGTVGTANVTFTNDDGDIIETTQHQAIGQLRINGLQSRIIFKYRTFSAYANYTFTNPYRINEDNSLTRIGDIASHGANTGVNQLFFNKLNVNLRVNWVGEKPTGVNTTIASNPYNSVDAFWILNGAITYNLFKGIYLQVSAENILDVEYFNPGVRSADGDYYGSIIPQNERNIRGSLIIKL